MILTNMNILNKRQKGMSLIEVMIAMVIGLLLLSGAMTMFMSNQRVYREQNEMGLLQENARFLMHLLVRDIRRAAFVGCVDEITNVTNNLPAADIQVTDIKNFSVSATSNLIEGSENGANWQPSNSTESIASMITATDGTPSDAITVRYLKSTGILVTGTMAGNGDDIITDGIGTLADGSYVAIGDCGGTDIFQITTIVGDNTAATITHGGLSRTYDDNARMYILGTYRYGIGNSTNGTGPALWRTTPAGDEELIEGVESLQILYGEDTSADGLANSFIDAGTVADWSNVVSVKIAVLMRTVDENNTNDDDGTTYSLLGTNVGPINDKRRRRTFSATVEIRNKRT